MSGMSDLNVKILEEIVAKDLKVGDKIAIDGYEYVITKEDIDQCYGGKCDIEDVARGEVPF